MQRRVAGIIDGAHAIWHTIYRSVIERYGRALMFSGNVLLFVTYDAATHLSPAKTSRHSRFDELYWFPKLVSLPAPWAVMRRPAAYDAIVMLTIITYVGLCVLLPTSKIVAYAKFFFSH